MDRAILSNSFLCALLLLIASSAPTYAQGFASHSEASAAATASSAPSTEDANVTRISTINPPPARLASGDVVEVTVFDTPELSQKTRIDNDGDLELVVGGKVCLAGLTASEAGQAIETSLQEAKVLRHPRVSVNVVASTAQTVTVLGEVKNPGSYPIWGRQSATDAIAGAGGVTQFASHSATLTRKDSKTSINIDLNGTARPTEPELFLLPGDRIVVARAGTIYVLGDVGRPGGFTLDDRVPTTVLQGLALAQGMNRTASFHGALIRQTPAGPQQEALDLKKILANQSSDPTLRDGDIVYVPLNAAKDWANRGLNSILQMAVGVVIYGRY
jgi:polysaccharide export outer membrane protein